MDRFKTTGIHNVYYMWSVKITRLSQVPQIDAAVTNEINYVKTLASNTQQLTDPLAVKPKFEAETFYMSSLGMHFLLTSQL